MVENIILFAGKAGAGKNFSADKAAFVLDESNITSKQVAFADKVKETAYSLLWDGVKDERGRRLLQHVGAVGREYDKDIWVKLCIKEIDSWEGTGVALITDLRFPNELEKVKEAFPNKVKVVHIIGRQADLGNNAKDISEHAMDEFDDYDYVINNNGSEEDLLQEVRAMLSSFEITK